MTDTKLLERKIEESGLKKGHIADTLNLSRCGFFKKINNLSEFKQTEISTLVEVLRLSNKEKDEIFFKKDVI